MGQVLSLEACVRQVEAARARGETIVFTNGCFDLLHRGHLELLRAARALGDRLVVALNTDASVRRLKGPARPLVGEEDRAALVAALEPVDWALLFDEDTPARSIERILPDVLVKGGDYRPEEIVGAGFVTARGGQVRVVPLLAGRSTSDLVRAVLRAHGKGADGG